MGHKALCGVLLITNGRKITALTSSRVSDKADSSTRGIFRSAQAEFVDIYKFYHGNY